MKKDSEETLSLFLHSLILAAFFVALLVVAGLSEERPWKIVRTDSDYAGFNFQLKTMQCNEKNKDACQDFVDAVNDAHERHQPHAYKTIKVPKEVSIHKHEDEPVYGKKVYTVKPMGD